MISAIFACKEAIISVLTERATPLRQSDLSLVAFLKKKSLRGSKKALNLAKLATLRASLLLTAAAHVMHFQTYTHVQEYLDHGQSEGGSALHYL